MSRRKIKYKIPFILPAASGKFDWVQTTKAEFNRLKEQVDGTNEFKAVPLEAGAFVGVDPVVYLYVVRRERCKGEGGK